jgi:hypothetical protein
MWKERHLQLRHTMTCFSRPWRVKDERVNGSFASVNKQASQCIAVADSFARHPWRKRKDSSSAWHHNENRERVPLLAYLVPTEVLEVGIAGVFRGMSAPMLIACERKVWSPRPPGCDLPIPICTANLADAGSSAQKNPGGWPGARSMEGTRYGCS